MYLEFKKNPISFSKFFVFACFCSQGVRCCEGTSRTAVHVQHCSLHFDTRTPWNKNAQTMQIYFLIGPSELFFKLRLACRPVDTQNFQREVATISPQGIRTCGPGFPMVACAARNELSPTQEVCIRTLVTRSVVMLVKGQLRKKNVLLQRSKPRASHKWPSSCEVGMITTPLTSLQYSNQNAHAEK